MSSRRTRWAALVADARGPVGVTFAAYRAGRPGLDERPVAQLEGALREAAREYVRAHRSWIEPYMPMVDDALDKVPWHVLARMEAHDARGHMIAAVGRNLSERTQALRRLLVELDERLERMRRYPPRGVLELAEELQGAADVLLELVVLTCARRFEPRPSVAPEGPAIVVRGEAGEMLGEHFLLVFETAIDRDLEPEQAQPILALAKQALETNTEPLGRARYEACIAAMITAAMRLAYPRTR